MRKLKKELSEFLHQADFEKNLSEIHKFIPKKAINSLFTFLYSPDKQIKTRAAKSMGEIVSKIAEENIEFARVIIRRLMISLTEESGAIGWGAPLAMGEIMARNRQLAEEYHKILISYSIEEEDNYLDFEGLQKDVIAGIKRLAEVYPDLVEDADHLRGAK